VILGASLCGLASPFLQPAMQSSDAVIEAIEGLRNEFSTAMFLLGMQTVEELQDNDALILQP
jgi:isopentenyl-diphosphate delta-isomerase